MLYLVVCIETNKSFAIDVSDEVRNGIRKALMQSIEQIHWLNCENGNMELTYPVLSKAALAFLTRYSFVKKFPLMIALYFISVFVSPHSLSIHRKC